MSQSYIVVTCPHCDGSIQIYNSEVNCAIFRHAVLKENMCQIDPHATKEVCERLIKQKKVFGCGRPFKLVFHDEVWTAIPCDYV